MTTRREVLGVLGAASAASLLGTVQYAQATKQPPGPANSRVDFPADWPQWRGPNRDGVSREAGLHLDWSQKKPSLLWVFREAGSGYSSPTIVGRTLYCQGAKDSDFAFALDTETGKLRWKQPLGPAFVQDRGDGPRGAVTVDGDALFLIRGAGELHRLAAADGQSIWKKDLRADLGGGLMSQWDWGYSESPLIDGERAICTPGGSKGTLAALDKRTGDVVWRSVGWTESGGFTSPIVADVDGVRQYIQLVRGGVAGVAAKDGTLLWRVDVASNTVAIIPTPIYHDHLVYVTSGYGAGCGCVRLSRDGDKFKADLVYANKNLSNHHGGVVLVGEHVYGYGDYRGWVCQNLKTGENVWQEKGDDKPGKGAVISVDGRLLCLDENTGSLTCAKASPEGWKEFGRLELPEKSSVRTMDNKMWTHPVVANGKLYLRHHDLLFCFNLKTA
jgi:outer membrane protein assembly factor BamB